MFELLMQVVRRFFSSGLARQVMLVSVAFVALGLAIVASGLWRKKLAKWREGGGILALVISMLAGIFKLLLIVVILRLFVIAFSTQEESFRHKHGRVTERNRKAVLDKWGRPQEQQELAVTHYLTRIKLVEQLRAKIPDTSPPRYEYFTRQYYQGEEPPILEPINGEMPKLVRTTKQKERRPLPLKSLLAADVEVHIKASTRTLGGANYAGYENVCQFKYELVNPGEDETEAELAFPMPASVVNLDRFSLVVDGQDWLAGTRMDNNRLVWKMPMSPGEKRTVEVSYQGRGLEHFRYIPARMEPKGRCRVDLTVENVPPDRLDFPIGSMPSQEKLTEIKGMPYTLHWNLDNAITAYDIGVRLPQPEQPGYHVARLLAEAPLGLMVMVFMLVLTALICRGQVSVLDIALLSLAYYLFYVLLGHLYDALPRFSAAFVLSACPVVILVGLYRLGSEQRKFVGWQDAVLFALFVLGYPLAVVAQDYTGLLLHIGFYILLAYLMGLLVARQLRGRGKFPAESLRGDG